jgi:hypothetical protein
MQSHVFPSVNGNEVELDLCYPCHGMWLDPQENLKLAPAAVAELFKLLYEHRGSTHQPLSNKMNCPRCNSNLSRGFDVVRSGRYITYRCAKGHGRFSAFSSFMIEKGFVRLLTNAEIDDIATRVAVIHCSSCGAPVDLRKDHACLHCRSALSLLDPTAVEKALQGYAKATATTATIKLPELADALVGLERDRQRALREQKAQGGSVFTREVPDIDLWVLGVTMVAKMLD